MTKPLPILLLLTILAGAMLIAQQQPAKTASSKPATTSFDAQVQHSRTEMFEQGKQVFRFDTFGDEAYWEAFRNVYEFVFARFVNLAGGGEWFERVDREGKPLDTVLGHGWKSSYHTVRTMVQCIRRLRALGGGPA